jgi:hypothetical protein
MRVFSEMINLGRKTHPECGWHHPQARDLDGIRGKGESLPA